MLKIISCILVLFSMTSQAKDLSNRLGIGYSDQFSVSIPAIMAMYYPNPETGFSASLGVSTKDNDSKFGLMLKFYRVIFPEDNLNFYMGGGAGLLSNEQSGTSDSGFELNGFVGAEYFFQGLESLSFRMETGLGIVSVDSGVTFRTLGQSMFNAGMVFYF